MKNTKDTNWSQLTGSAPFVSLAMIPVVMVAMMLYVYPDKSTVLTAVNLGIWIGVASTLFVQGRIKAT